MLTVYICWINLLYKFNVFWWVSYFSLEVFNLSGEIMFLTIVDVVRADRLTIFVVDLVSVGRLADVLEKDLNIFCLPQPFITWIVRQMCFYPAMNVLAWYKSRFFDQTPPVQLFSGKLLVFIVVAILHITVEMLARAHHLHSTELELRRRSPGDVVIHQGDGCMVCYTLFRVNRPFLSFSVHDWVSYVVDEKRTVTEGVLMLNQLVVLLHFFECPHQLNALQLLDLHYRILW